MQTESTVELYSLHVESIIPAITPESESTLEESSIPHNHVSSSKDSPQNIDPIVTLFDNAIVSLDICSKSSEANVLSVEKTQY